MRYVKSTLGGQFFLHLICIREGGDEGICLAPAFASIHSISVRSLPYVYLLIVKLRCFF